MFRLLMILLVMSGCSKEQKEKKAPVARVKLEKAIQKDVPFVITGVGNSKPYLSVKITPQVEGTVTGYFGVDGKEVKKGDLLFTIDDRQYLAALEEASGALSQAEANLGYQTSRVLRYKDLLPDDYVSKLSFEQYRSEEEGAQGHLEQMQGSLDKAKVNFEWCTIKAPISGVLGERKVDPGNVVKPNQEEALLVINQISPIYVEFSVAERFLPMIHQYQTEEGLLVSMGEVTGRLDFIDNAIDKSTGTITLRAVYPNEEKAIWPGQFLRANVHLYTIENAVLVPEIAIGKDTKGSYLFVAKEDHTVEIRRVTLGQRHESYRVVEKGVKAGESVVTGGKNALYPGAKYESQ